MPVKPKKFSLFGKDKNYLVLEVSSKIAELRNAYGQALGAVSDFSSYKPHISISKNSGVTNVHDLEPFTDILYVNRETVTVLDTKFKPGAEPWIDPALIKYIMQKR